MKTNRHRARFNKALSDAAMSFLLGQKKKKNKANEYGSEIISIGRYEKSSQTCNNCGYINKDTKNLGVRSWRCPQCGLEHNRDINAAINILKMSKREIYH